MSARIIVSAVGAAVASPVTGLGRYLLFLFEVFRRLLLPAVQSRIILRQMEFVGNRSIGIICLSGVMVGGVFGFQLGDIFRIFGAESMLGAAAGFALCKELAPVIGSLLVTARAGSAMAAEIGTMRVNEQIDAMRVMAVNPYNYLVAPRVIASVCMMPLLSAMFVICGVLTAYAVGVMFFRVDEGIFYERIRWIIAPRHVIQGMEKAAIFGLIFASIGCYKGFHAAGGAKGVGRATTEAVVASYVTILISDFFLSYAQFERVM